MSAVTFRSASRVRPAATSPSIKSGIAPGRGVAAALVRPRPAACDVERRPRLADRAKAGVFALLVLLGVAIAAPKLWAMTQPDPHLDPVAGDPAWLHVSDE